MTRKELESELKALCKNFPHPRNEPGEAVDRLHRIREILAQMDGRGPDQTAAKKDERDA